MDHLGFLSFSQELPAKVVAEIINEASIFQVKKKMLQYKLST